MPTGRVSPAGDARPVAGVATAAEPSSVEVPGIVGASIGEAEITMRAAGLRLAFAGGTPEDGATVKSQTPEGRSDAQWPATR